MFSFCFFYYLFQVNDEVNEISANGLSVPDDKGKEALAGKIAEFTSIVN